MRLTTALLVAICLHVSASTFSQSVTFSGKAVPLEKVFTAIKKQTGFVVWGKSELLKQAATVSVSAQDMPLTAFLDVVMKDQFINYKIAGNTIMLFGKPAASTPGEVAQPVMVSPVGGQVTDSMGAPLIGATITIVGSSQSTITNDIGGFNLFVSLGNKVRISFIGYKTKEIVITSEMLQSGNIGKVILSVSTANLAELAVTANTGYQTIPKERATGSFSIVTEKTLGARMETNLLDRLEGTVPGLFINNGSISIRGISTLYGNQSPLYVVDGFPYEGDINYINPSDVVNVTVMKDAAATSIYGTRAANGVISITTRSGSSRKLTVNFNSTVFINAIPDAGYMHLLNSKQMVDLQQEVFNTWHPSFSDDVRRAGQPKALEAMYNYEQNFINKQTLDSTLNGLSQANGQQQLEDMFMRKKVKQRYAFSADGGNEIHQYNLMMNYTGDREYGFRTGNENVNIGLKDKVKVFKWLDAEAGISTNVTKGSYIRESPESYYRNNMPYDVLKNTNGSYGTYTKLKSPYEIDRLKSIGLDDETFNPLNELDKSDLFYSSNYFRLQGGFTVRIIRGLSLDLKYQTERGTNYNKQNYGPDSYWAKNMIDDAAQLIDGELVKNVPDGGLLYETRGDSKSYTARAQLNFDRRFGSKHHISALAGGERRSIAQSSTTVFKMGYNDNNLQFLPVDQIALGNLKGTESLGSTFSQQFNDNNNFYYGEDRYISAYGNAGYTYNDKYNLTGSVRVDNSNLFGTDPRYRYLPLWSIGASWRMSEEKFLKNVSWLSNLTLRSTYGLGGNVARTVGPYLQASSTFFSEANATATDIIYPPNKSLRWEKTATTNIGVDYGFFNGRISGSADYYIRKTTDLLGEKATDPTNAFPTALINYGSLNNKGFELALNTVNIKSRDFNWNTTVSLGLNKNKMTKIDTRSPDIYGMTAGYGVNTIGHPMDAVYNFKYAGLDPTNGSVMVYDAKGKVVTNYDPTGTIVANMTDINGLVYNGTLRPTYTVGFTNSFNWKQLTLNIIMIANGGNVLRDVVPALSYNLLSQNQDSRIANFWRQPGDEKKPGMMPAPDLQANGGLYYTLLHYASDKNTLKADYVKIRDISLSYSLPASLLRSAKMSAAKFTLQVQNPFHWYRNSVGIDPEAYSAAGQYANRTLPVMATYMAGVDVTF